MALNDKRLSYLGVPTDLLGYQDYRYAPYPDTPLQIQNELARDSYNRNREEAANDAMYTAQNEATQQVEAEEFARKLTIGSVVKPQNSTLGAYKAMLYRSSMTTGQKDDARWDVRFSTENYGAFDAIIAKNAGADSAAFDPKNPHYREFSSLRRNIALVRNYLMCELFPDGEFIPDAHSPDGREDKSRYAMLNQMAEKLGEALKSDKPSAWKNLLKGNPLTTPDANDFMQAANIPDKGALVLYNYLEGLHETPTFKDFYTKETALNWTLPPRGETPFSDDNVRTSSRSASMQGASDAYEQIVMRQLRAPENLSPEDSATSVKLAREILERLKKLIASPTDRDYIAQFADEKQDENTKLLKLAESYREVMAQIADADPSAIQNNRIFEKTHAAFEQLGYRMKVETYKALMADKEWAAAGGMLREMERTPDRYKTDASTESLLSQVGEGLSEASRIETNLKQADIARRQANQAAREAQRAARRAQKASMRSDAAQLSTAAIMKASKSSRSALGAKAAIEKAASAAGQSSFGFDMDKMSGAQVMDVSQNGFALTRKLEEERQVAPVLNDPNSNRGR